MTQPERDRKGYRVTFISFSDGMRSVSGAVCAGRHSQSAMEYLMTYGWAILIIAVVLAALFELGVFNVNNLGPRAPPGSCHVFRPDGPDTTAFINTEGLCSGELPQYVANFNGNTSSMTIPTFPASTFSASSGFTFSFWMNVKNQYASGSTGCGGPPRNLVAIETSTNKVYMQGQGSLNPYFPAGMVEWVYNGTGWQPVSTPPIIQPGVWYFVAGGANTSTGIEYVDLNSNFTSKGGIESIVFPVYKGLIGGRDGCGLTFNGSIANVQIYNVSLSQPEVQALYHEGIGGAPIDIQNIVGWWPLNGNAQDYSGNNNNGQIIGGVTFTGSWTSGYSAP